MRAGPPGVAGLRPGLAPGTALKELREKTFLTQAELAAEAGLTEATVNALERDKQQARISTVRKLAEALGVRP